jgi:hypothetical protein
VGTTAREADFRGAALPGANFQRADLVGADFRDANLRGVDFTGAILDGTDFDGANLKGAKLSRAASHKGIQGLPVDVQLLNGKDYKERTVTPTTPECVENERYWATATVEGGSVEDLSQQLDLLQVPTALVAVEEHYKKHCRAVCPSLERWYDVKGPLKPARRALLSKLYRDGTELERQVKDPRVVTMQLNDYLYSIKFGRRARNGATPGYVDVDASVAPLEEP